MATKFTSEDAAKVIAETLPNLLTGILCGEVRRRMEATRKQIAAFEELIRSGSQHDVFGIATHVVWAEGEPVCVSVTFDNQLITSDVMTTTRMTPETAEDIAREAKVLTDAYRATLPPDVLATARDPKFKAMHIIECASAMKSIAEGWMRDANRALDIAESKAKATAQKKE
jgi:hypothetical protein